jgi:hypothetical protein
MPSRQEKDLRVQSMTIEEKLFLKLEPHAKRIKDGEGNDFDYLPAVLLHLIAEQKRQAQLLDNNAKFLDLIKSAVDAAGLQNKANTADLQMQCQNLQTSIGDQIGMLGREHEMSSEKTNEGLKAVSSEIEALVKDNQKSHSKVMRFVIAGLVGSTLMIGLAIAILQRH